MGKASNSDIISLAADFDRVGRDEWLVLAQKALAGRSIDDVLTTTTYEGVTLNALYHREDAAGGPDPAGFPGAMPFTRGAALPQRTRDGWEIRQLHAQPDPVAANGEIRADLSGGAQSLVLRLDQGARCLSEDRHGKDGLVIRRVDDLAEALAGVNLARTAITLQAGAAALPAAALFLALADRRGVDPAVLTGNLGFDPLAALAADGWLPGPLDRQFKAAAALAGWCVANAPGLRVVCIDTDVYHSAGATETLDLAFAMAAAVAHLRVMIAAGLEIDDACGQIAFSLPVTTDVFQGIAKFRAARRLWARIAEASGADVLAARLHAVTATRNLSRRDPWVNQLRATCSCFAAGVGGADSITVRAHTDALGAPLPLARRVARNIQTILVQEASLARVADPAGGSYYVERLSDEYACRAWALFQDIEAADGMGAALLSGKVSSMIETAWDERARNLARRRDQLTGISSFPNLEEDAGSVALTDQDALRTIVDRGHAETGVAVPDYLDIAALAAAADAGASLAALARPLRGAAVTIPALRPHRLGEAFEDLRDASDAWLAENGRRPCAFMACLGTPADYTARAMFTKSYLTAGGIETLETETDLDGGRRQLAGRQGRFGRDLLF